MAINKISDIDDIDLPREKLAKLGVKNLRDHELLAILLRTGFKGKNVLEMCKEILEAYDLTRFLTLELDEWTKIKGISTSKACVILASLELSRRILDKPETILPTINEAKDAVALLNPIRTHSKEHLVAIYLNATNQVIHQETISIGILDQVLVHPREIFEPAIRHLAGFVILAHNHPSGLLEPSDNDLEFTKQIIEAGKIIGIEVVDHLILTKKGYVSILEDFLE